MSTRPLLTSGVDERDALIESQQDEIRQLKADLRVAQAETAAAKVAAGRSVANIRKVMTPLYEGLCQLFREMDKVAPGSSETAPVNGKTSAVWDAWKGRLGTTAAKVIDALLTHGELAVGQLAMATGLNRNTITKSGIYPLNKASLINKNAGKFSLKKI